VSTAARATTLTADLLERLSLALEAREPGQAVRDALSSVTLAEATRERVLGQALLVGRRSRYGALAASSAEVRLSLAVAWVLCGALAGEQPGS
jgi:hypothetical protein